MRGLPCRWFDGLLHPVLHFSVFTGRAHAQQLYLAPSLCGVGSHRSCTPVMPGSFSVWHRLTPLMHTSHAWLLHSVLPAHTARSFNRAVC